MSPNGRIAISLRIGPPDTDRAMFEVTLPELSAIGRQFGLRLVHTHDSPDRLERPGISWTTAVLGLPDDGLGALPLLRHLVLADTKSSTYKIALLRILARIADSAAGTARHAPESVVVPMGLVALFWLRMYKPLIEAGLAQMPINRDGKGPGFAAGDDARQRFFVEAAQTLPMLSASQDSYDVIGAMKLQRIRLAKDQGLRPWAPKSSHDSANAPATGQPFLA